MTDVLIRNVPEDVVAALDARAARLGISRGEFLRRRLNEEARPSASCTIADLEDFSETFADLADPDVMSGAWH